MKSISNTELSERFDPMTVKELCQNLRRGNFVIPFLSIQALALAAIVAEFRSGSSSGSSRYSGALNIWMLVDSGPFWMVTGAICLCLMPLAGLFLMEQEMEDGNHELLLLTRLDRWKIVIGKFTALWGLSLVTFVSILPYLVVRYLVGGVEWWHEAACAATVTGGSAMIVAGAIGASAFRNIGVRIAVFLLFLASMTGACLGPLAGSMAISRGCGIFYHANAVAAMVTHVVLGLALARSRLRLSMHAYEARPSGVLLAILALSPLVVGFITACTCGLGGIAGFAVITLLALRSDRRQSGPVIIQPAPLPRHPSAKPPGTGGGTV